LSLETNELIAIFVSITSKTRRADR